MFGIEESEFSKIKNKYEEYKNGGNRLEYENYINQLESFDITFT